MVRVMGEKFSEWEGKLEKFPYEVVEDGPLLENIQSGKDVDLTAFPVPKWHEQDGGGLGSHR